MACTAFAAVSGYIALFHTPLLMTANLLIVVAVAATPAFALGAAGGVMWAVCTCTVVPVINIAVPYGVQVIVHLLGDDVLRADFDRSQVYSPAGHSTNALVNSWHTTMVEPISSWR